MLLHMLLSGHCTFYSDSAKLWKSKESLFISEQGQDIYLVSKPSGPVLGPTKTPAQYVP